MRFTVTARSSTGEIVFEHTSLLNALWQSMGMSASGMSEVRIADGNGPARTPADLYQSLFGRDGACGFDKPTDDAETMALAA